MALNRLSSPSIRQCPLSETRQPVVIRVTSYKHDGHHGEIQRAVHPALTSRGIERAALVHQIRVEDEAMASYATDVEAGK
jgi:hypothetical protein